MIPPPWNFQHTLPYTLATPVSKWRCFENGGGGRPPTLTTTWHPPFNTTHLKQFSLSTSNLYLSCLESTSGISTCLPLYEDAHNWELGTLSVLVCLPDSKNVIGVMLSAKNIVELQKKLYLCFSLIHNRRQVDFADFHLSLEDLYIRGVQFLKVSPICLPVLNFFRIKVFWLIT